MPVVKAVQEQQQVINEQKEKLDTQTKDIKLLKEQLAHVEQLLKTFSSTK